MACTWFGEIFYCCSQTSLPRPAWVVFITFCKPFFRALYMYNSMEGCVMKFYIDYCPRKRVPKSQNNVRTSHVNVPFLQSYSYHPPPPMSMSPSTLRCSRIIIHTQMRRRRRRRVTSDTSRAGWGTIPDHNGSMSQLECVIKSKMYQLQELLLLWRSKCNQYLED